MGLYVGFDIVEDFGYLDETEEYGIVPDYTEGCEAFIKTFMQVSRELVPVDTGYLKSTLEADYNDTFCEAQTLCEYAQYQEYGTWCMPAQPYFEEAVMAGLQAAEPLWDEAEQEAIEEEIRLLEEEEEEQAVQMGQGFVGGFNFSSILGFIFSVIATIVVMSLIVFVQAVMGKDFSGSGGGGVYMPDIEII